MGCPGIISLQKKFGLGQFLTTHNRPWTVAINTMVKYKHTSRVPQRDIYKEYPTRHFQWRCTINVSSRNFRVPIINKLLFCMEKKRILKGQFFESWTINEVLMNKLKAYSQSLRATLAFQNPSLQILHNWIYFKVLSCKRFLGR